MKSSIATLIVQHRQLKGITQEELAYASKVSARTIQRIESGAVVPHPQTLKLIAGALELDYSTFARQEPTDNRPVNDLSLLPLLHVLPLIGIAVPFLNILLPLILWIMKKDLHPEYDIQGRQSINFQIGMTLFAVLAIVLLIVYFPVGFPLLIVVYAYAIVLCILNTIRAVRRDPVKYPLSIPFLKLKQT